MQDSILTTVVKDIDGEVTTLEKFAGNVLLIVNVASKCGLTPQYEQLENIQKAWVDRGFMVLGFPCNQFLEQEPGSDEEIKTYCTTTWGVTFPMFSKIEVNGEGRHPLYQRSTSMVRNSSFRAGRERILCPYGQQRPCTAVPG